MQNLIPPFIYERYRENILKGEFKGGVMAVDTVGFVSITEGFRKYGKEGSELVAEILSRIFSKVVEEIYKRKGFVSGFTGDGFIAIFPGPFYQPIEILEGGRAILETFKNVKLNNKKLESAKLSVKIGISWGNIEWRIVKNERQNIFFFKGEAISNADRIQHYAGRDQILLHENFKSILPKGLKFSKIYNTCYLLKTLPKTTFTGKIKNIKLNPSVVKSFVPSAVLNLKSLGEFRDIISCFIFFEDAQNIEENISKMIELSYEYGGYLNKVYFGHEGGMALVLFGAPVSKEKKYKRACDFSLSLVRNLKMKSKIGLASGVSYTGFIGGELQGEYTAIGPVVNRSERYSLKANWKEIYLDDTIYAKIKKEYEIKYLSHMDFKGMRRHTPVYKLIKEVEKTAEPFFKGRWVGREKELDKIIRLLEPLYENRFGGIIYIYGTAGIGKSRLVQELKNKLDINKYNWFYMPCDEILRKGFNPFIHFLKNYFNQSKESSEQENKKSFENKLNKLISQLKDKEIKKTLSKIKPVLGALIGIFWKETGYENLSPKEKYENVLYAIKTLIKAESMLKPTIIIIEDIHYIDSDSARLLKVLTRNVEEYPFIIISTCRCEEDEEFKGFYVGDVPENKIRLKKLLKENVKELIADRLGAIQNLPEETVNFIWERGEGNPFYTEQIILYLKENNLIDENNRLVKGSFEIPARISSILISRIDALPAELKEVVKVASIIGREFEVDLLPKVLHNPMVAFWLKEGEKRAIWQPITEKRYMFKHQLIRETVYEMQLKKERKRLHRLVAQTIESLYKDNSNYYASLANHYDKAEVTKKAIHYLEKAGNYAKDNYQNRQALVYYERLLSKIKKREEFKELQIDISLKTADVLERMGLWKDAQNIYAKIIKPAKKLKDNLRLAKIYNAWGNLCIFQEEYEKAMRHLKTALYISEKNNYNEIKGDTWGKIGNIYWFEQKYKEAMKCYKKMLKISEEINDKIGVAIAIGNIGLVYKSLGENRKALKYYKKKLKLSKELGFKRGIANVVGNMAAVYRDMGDIEKSLKCIELAISYWKELDIKYNLCMDMQFKAELLFSLKQYKKARYFNEEAFKLAKEVGDKETIFYARILKERINFALSKGENEIKRVVSNFKSLLKEIKEERYKAKVNYELFKLYKILCSSSKTKKRFHNLKEKYRKKALKAYRKMYENSHKFSYKKIMEELMKK